MMSPTLNMQPLDARAAAGQSLQFAAQHALHLYQDAKQAHWNVQGLAFIGLHKLFDKVAEFAATGAPQPTMATIITAGRCLTIAPRALG